MRVSPATCCSRRVSPGIGEKAGQYLLARPGVEGPTTRARVRRFPLDPTVQPSLAARGLAALGGSGKPGFLAYEVEQGGDVTPVLALVGPQSSSSPPIVGSSSTPRKGGSSRPWRNRFPRRLPSLARRQRRLCSRYSDCRLMPMRRAIPRPVGAMSSRAPPVQEGRR